MRYSRISELFSAASVNDFEGQHIYVKYHSALAHNYILLGQFDHFLEQWKKILQLKWSPTQSKQVGCTSAHLALAHFGQGDYEQSAKLILKALLKSKSLRGSRKVKKAAQLLTKDHYLSLQLEPLKPQIMLITQLTCLLFITDI